MIFDRSALRWNGWGNNDAPDILGSRADAVWQWMGENCGCTPLPETLAKDLDGLELPTCGLDASALDGLRKCVDENRLKRDDYERAFHARGKSYLDLIHLRAGDLGMVPDAVVYPESKEEVLAVLQWAVEHKSAVLPYGGGSSVVGGVNALKGDDQQAVISLDLTRMKKVISIDKQSRRATIQAGIYGPELEEQLQVQGYTLGHYPQSFEFSTLGGWIAHRGAGQQSNKYGKAEKWLVGAEVATPKGIWRTEYFPASGAGPQMRDMLVGSEGVLGVITEATVRIHPLSEAKDYRGYLFMDWEQAVAATQALAQSGIPTAMVRLSDPDESHFFQALKTIGEEEEPTIKFCALLVGIEGDTAQVESDVVRCRALLDGFGAMHMGEDPGKSWYANRFMMPYLRDPMLDHGLGVDTLETAVDWTHILTLHRDVSQAIQEALDAHAAVEGAKAIVMAHVSHSYADGASLYFTCAFLRDLADPIAQWLAVKTAATEAILESGGTISHHHGVGTDHLPWVNDEKGLLGVAMLRNLKVELDPDGVLNPGKLIPEPPMYHV